MGRARSISAAALAGMTALLLTAGTPAAPQALIDSGRLQGVRQGAIDVYKGVPFAAPPVGDLRWRPPQPAAPWTGVRKADAFAPACMQTGVSMPGEAPPKISEDCLYLNIWAPPRGRGPLPVIVWIYGGGFTNGSASMPLYWGDSLAKKGAVVVTIAYRVGPFGFLAHPDLTAESVQHSSGNYGVQDQIAALRWVRRNIAAFGGDPQRVTVAGQSAGSMSVSILMASPAAKGLFQRAIGESGGFFEPVELAPSYRLANAEKDGRAYALSLGAASIADLRRLPAEALLKAKAAGQVSHPVIEPMVLPRPPYAVFQSGAQNDVPLLVGSNAQEARSLQDPGFTTSAATFAADITRRWGPLPPQLLAAYPHDTDETARQARLDFERDLRFGWDAATWARLQAAKGSSPVFAYQFRQEPPFPAGSVPIPRRPSHFAELWYVFGHLGQEAWAWTASDRALSETMTSYWVNFARTGDPNGPTLPAWPMFKTDTETVLNLGNPIAPGPLPNVQAIGVFDKVYGAVRGP